jgi:hypothetical protein
MLRDDDQRLLQITPAIGGIPLLAEENKAIVKVAVVVTVFLFTVSSTAISVGNGETVQTIANG